MKNRYSFIVSALASAVALLAVVAWTNRPVAQPVPKLIQPVQERIVDLPEDGQEYHCSLMLHDNWREIPREREMVAWFDVEPRLASLKAQAHFHLYTASDPLYKERFAKDTPVPAILIQDAEGRVVYEDHEFQTVGQALGDKVARLFPLFHRHHNVCPAPSPAPEPPDVDVNVHVAPNLVPHLPPPAPQFPWLIAIIAVAVSGGITFVLTFKRDAGL